MSRLRSHQPFAPISSNIISSKPDLPVKQPPAVYAGPLMENLITHYGESDTQSFEALEDHSSDSSFERRMLREMKMEREASLAARPRPFSKANKRPIRSRVTLDQFDRNPVRNNPPPAEIYTASSGEDQRDDARVQQRNSVPKVWGSRAKRGPGFLDRFNRATRDQTPVVEASGLDWAEAAADVALPSTEDSPLSRKGSTRGTPSTVQRERNQSLDKVLSWDVDFSGHSMISSTPAVRTRNRRLEDIRQAEIEASVEQVAFTPPPRERPRLDEIRQAEADAAAEFTTSPYETPSSVAGGRSANPLEIQGAKRPEQAPSLQSEDHKTELARPDHARQDSRDLLRRLSRSVSGTPDGKAKPATPLLESSNSRSAPTNAQREVPSDMKETWRQPGPEFVLRSDFLSGKPKDEMRAGLSGSTKGLQESIPPNSTSLKTTSTSVAQTPVVTGAWVETPGPVRSQSLVDSKLQSKDVNPTEGATAPTKSSGVDKGKSQEIPEPQLPRSALSAIVGKAKASNMHGADADIGDATIQSLEDVMDLEDHLPEGMLPAEEDELVVREIEEQRILANLQYSEKLLPTTEEVVLTRKLVKIREERGIDKRRPGSPFRRSKLRQEYLSNEANENLTPRKRGRLEEDLQLQRMSERVSTMHSRTRSLNAGLGRIERQISGASGCHHCGCPGNCYGAHPFSALGRSLKSAFYQKEDGKRRPTRLGWLLTLCLLWVILESIMCLVICKPVYEDTMGGFGFYPDRPEPPYVLAKTAFGPLWSILSIPASVCFGIGNWAWNLLWYALEKDEVQASIVSTASRVLSTASRTVISQTVFESDWSMEADETI